MGKCIWNFYHGVDESGSIVFYDVYVYAVSDRLFRDRSDGGDAGDRTASGGACHRCGGRSLQGWIMDRTKPGKLGKYKPYIILSIAITAISILALYCLPGFVSANPVLTVIYVLFFYIAYDVGTSFTHRIRCCRR